MTKETSLSIPVIIDGNRVMINVTIDVEGYGDGDYGDDYGGGLEVRELSAEEEQ